MKIQLLIFTLSFNFIGPLYANDNDHDHAHDKYEEHHEHGREHEEDRSSYIDNDLARSVGIETSLALPKTLQKTVTTYGSLVLGPEQLSHVRARFRGRVQSVQVSIGDTVQAGDLLAEIESNESLKTYSLHAPISGLVVQRHANTGEATQDKILFSIGNFEYLWAELRIYPAQHGFVKNGQPVTLYVNNQSVNATVEHVIPVLDKPYQFARVKIDNKKIALAPGLQVEARVEIGLFEAPVAIAKDALQTLGGQQGVFVKYGDEYRFTPLTLGPRDDHFISVLDGLSPKTEYVSGNSYLLKADIEKSEAEHEH